MSAKGPCLGLRGWDSPPNCPNLRGRLKSKQKLEGDADALEVTWSFEPSDENYLSSLLLSFSHDILGGSREYIWWPEGNLATTTDLVLIHSVDEEEEVREEVCFYDAWCSSEQHDSFRQSSQVRKSVPFLRKVKIAV